MAGHTGLKKPVLALLVAGVLLAHVEVMDRIGDALESPSQLKAMPVVMYSRVLQPAVAPPPPPAPVQRQTAVPRKKSAAVAPKPRASEPIPEAPPEPAKVAEAPPPPQPLPDDKQAAAAPAPPPEPPASTPKLPDLSTWPADTRLNYVLGGQFRGGPLFGTAQVRWQRDGANYEVRAEIDVVPWAHLTMTSQGEVAADGLAPKVYEEETRGRKRRRATLEGDFVRLDNGNAVLRPADVQDTASQFVALGHRFADGSATLRAGVPVTVWLARPGGVDLWTYDVTGPEPLATPKLGAIEAYHLKPRPLPNVRGNIYAEMWFAPSLQHLPVQIRIRMGEADYIDLTVESIEQR